MSARDAPSAAPSSSHRLPTVSASQALGQIHARGSRAVSTGLPQLNEILSPQTPPGREVEGGLIRGKVTEIYGPSGVGKTAFGIQAAVSALREGHSVVWVDAGASLVPKRFNDVLNAPTTESAAGNVSPTESTLDELQSHFHHFATPTLAHLLALIMHPPSSFPPPNTNLMVIDSLSTLFDNAYPRNSDDRPSRARSDQARWAARRKFAVINELISSLSRIAAMHDIALLVTSQTITRIRGASRALLVPAISGTEWESGIATRLVLFRDWVPLQGKWCDANPDREHRARFAGVVKADGEVLAEDGGVGNIVPYSVEATGLCAITALVADIAPLAALPQSNKAPKRRFEEIDDNAERGPNSDELYGWVEDDEVAAEGLLFDEDPATAADPDTTAVPQIAGSRTDCAIHTKVAEVAQESFSLP